MSLTYLTKLRSRAELENPRVDQPGTMTDDERTRTAKAIIDAGKKRRGELIDEAQPIDATAEAILRAGRRRRNEED